MHVYRVIKRHANKAKKRDLLLALSENTKGEEERKD